MDHDRDAGWTSDGWLDTNAFEQSIQNLGYESRKATTRTPELTELDFWGEIGDLARLADFLARAGLTAFRSRRRSGHRFFMAMAPGGWIKVDVKLRSPEPQSALIGDLIWMLIRKRGLVVALLGADGAGKSTAASCVNRAMPVDLVTRYLGAPRRPLTPHQVREDSATGSPGPAWRSFAGLPKWMVRTVSQLWSVELAARRGSVVLCDRHPIEAGRLGDEPALVKALKRAIVLVLTPPPDLTLLLAAPGEVLFERKGEHSPEYLDQITTTWADLVARRHGVVIEVARPPEDVCLDIQQQIWVRLAARRQM
ncbi:MAG: hypothetical protein JJE47_17795 [Acidimicrobiia bacterium]|nr:hypothetical protein [Acidimicrobiia bacterium]